MKKMHLLLLVVFATTASYSQTFIAYGNSNISQQEFLKAYNKNKGDVINKEKALREYIDLYTNFKLKVKAAEELGLDTLDQIKYDVDNFRTQIMDNYLSDEKGIERLTNEAFIRAAKDLKVEHYYVPLTPSTSPSDTEKAYTSIMAVHAALKAGKPADASLVENIPAAVGVVKHNNLGFITAFTIPYEYESVIYNLKKGEFNRPYRSRNGWHIFDVTDERKSAGRWRIAQILVSAPPDADDAAKTETLKKANRIYELLKNGDNFNATAKAYSDDKLSYLNGGELPEFGTGVYSSDFENEVMKLKADGDISKPFLTSFGYHIIKRMGFSATPAAPDESFMFDLKQKVMKDSRVNAEKEKYTREMIAKVSVRKLNAVKDTDLFRFSDSIMTSPSLEQTRRYPISNKKVLKVKEEELTGADWLAFVREYRANAAEYKGETNKLLWDKFVEVSALNYYKKNLELYSPEFKFQMQEFKEGNMLFEIMERNVWGKAINDSVGLLKHYNAHSTNFKWAESADVLIFNCSTAKIAQDAITSLKKGKNWRTISDEQSSGALQADSGRYEITQIVGANYASAPVKGAYTAIVTNIDGTATFVKYVNIYPANQQRSFDEARGLVINEYQQVLEQEWLAKLKKKYPVRVNESLIKDML